MLHLEGSLHGGRTIPWPDIQIPGKGASGNDRLELLEAEVAVANLDMSPEGIQRDPRNHKCFNMEGQVHIRLFERFKGQGCVGEYLLGFG